jgi:hypothetical protein
MKKVLVVLSMLGLLFSVSLAATAATEQQGSWNTYFDLGVTGASNNTVASTLPGVAKDVDYDGTSGYLLGVEYDWGRYVAVAEYTGNYFDAPSGESDYRSNTMLVRGGYYFINQDKIKVDGVLGYMKLAVTNDESSKKSYNFTNGGAIVGIDGTYKFSDKFSLNGSYAVTIGADCSTDALDDVNAIGSVPNTIKAYYGNPSISKSSSLNTYRLKGIYQWTEHISTYFSYSFLESKMKYSYDISGMNAGKVNADSTWYGWALGMNYQF